MIKASRSSSSIKSKAAKPNLKFLSAAGFVRYRPWINLPRTIENNQDFVYIMSAFHEPVAQLVEQRPFKAWAVRSNRTGFTEADKT